MTETISLHISYQTKSKDSDLENDIMLLALGLDYEAQQVGIRLACRSVIEERELHLILAGQSNNLERFLTKLKSKQLDYITVDDYEVSKPQPYKGKIPDWKYHDLVAAARAAYLRTTYMKDVGNILEQLVKENKHKN